MRTKLPHDAKAAVIRMKFYLSADYTEPSVLRRSESAIRQDIRDHLALCAEGNELLAHAEEMQRRLQTLLATAPLGEKEKTAVREMNDALARAADAVKRLTSLKEEVIDRCEGLKEELSEQMPRVSSVGR